MHATQGGKVKITVTNRGAETWTQGVGLQLGLPRVQRPHGSLVSGVDRAATGARTCRGAPR